MWYIFECKNCRFKFPYIGSTVTKFRFRFSNYKNTLRKFRKKFKKIIIKEIRKIDLKQKFHKHYCSDGHEGITNWYVILMDQVEEKKELRKKELYWINRLNTWAAVGLNARKCTKHTNHESFVKHFLQINRKDENVLNLYLLFSFIHLYYYYYHCYYHYYNMVVIFIVIIISR